MSDVLIQQLINIGTFVGIILLTFLVGYFANRVLKRLIRKSTVIMQTNPTNYLFLSHALTAVIYVTGFAIAIYTLPSMRALANTLLTGAGIAAVAIGFASQHALSNVISGFFIVIFKPYKINDRLKLRDLTGVVEDITLRHTVIRDFENRRILIPNSVISDDIIVNSDFSDGKIIKWIEVGISYDSDIDLARKIMQEEALKHPLRIDGRSAEQIANDAPEVPVRVIMLGEYSVTLRAWTWTKDNADAFAMGCDLLESIKKRFDKEGVEIPYPHRTVVEKPFKMKHKQLAVDV